MHVVGTAGHVDHGKSSLVQALTGTDPDRWIEEKLRGMTLDLGFAHLRFPDGVEAGIVDVPGHERFVHNMLAGAAGMELLLLVVAANEGVMPQTLEHLAILAHLDVRRAIVVLAKRDLVDDAELRAVEEEIRAALASTIVAGAPFVAVSTRTGEGVETLRDAIHDALVALPERASDAPVFLPVDRVFAISGRGTVVTGTLVQGTIRAGDTLQIDEPAREVRVRSLQVFGESRQAVSAGARVAVNVAGVDVAELHRGAVLADRAVGVANAMRVRFRTAGAPLRRRTPVRAHLGAAEILGTLVFDTAPAAEETSDATLFLRRAAATYPGEAFVARALSPKALLGGGTIGSTATAQIGDTAQSERETILAVLGASGLAPLGSAEIAARANVREERAEELLAELAARGTVRRLQKPVTYLGGAAADELTARIAAILARREAETPWVLGVTSLALARELAVDEPLLLRVLAADAEDGRIVARVGYYATLAHRPQLTSEQYAFFDRAAAADAAATLVPVELETLVAEIKRTKIPGLGQAFDTLLATGALVKVGADVYRGSQIAEIRRRLEASIRRDGPITMARFRDAVGTTRKYAVPLMEWFDATGVTVRDGDVRSLRGATRR
ncbi:selenocysteine-specific translation factor [Vulcanimicrobium alpinum]|uniref:Selenocysteine-specific elongation factor n=1 Tax=Vulcanimicrobium alpinum TaxID=3016050 RepID=A0AAN1XTU5_UNVUL|nr:selenocysteine-specific translation elongation factor [Vulcanimicrobium alpinum]BDE05019.1 selenocysteine-specific translation factor [Vulcanimicrobium alpinum]